jgi:glycosyltransferase involved in cell wall biosynthesis
LNILIFNWQDIRNPLGGGAEVHLHEIFSRIAKRSHNVTLLCSSFENAPREEIIDGITIIRHGNRNLFNFSVPVFYQKNFRKKFDVVIDDINKIPFYTPLFVKEPVVGIVHHLFGNSIFLETNFLAASYVSLSEQLLLPVYKNTPMMVVSESTAMEMEHIGFSRKNFSFAYNCVDHSKFQQTGIAKSKTPLIGFLGRLKKYKSIEHAIRAFALVKKEIPEAEFLIVGDGDYKNELEKTVRGLHLENSVHFSGFVSEEKKVELLQTMHVVVQPSAKEGWGLTVIEANACGTVCIASNVQGLRESVMNSETGFLFDYGNELQLAEKILLLLKNENLRFQLETNALQWAKKFNWEHSAVAVLETLESAMKRKS